MDYMDIDQVVDVPDTPDRLAAHNNNSNNIKNVNNSSLNHHLVSKDYIDERFKNHPREKNKPLTENGSRRLFIHPQNLSNSAVSVLGNSSSSRDPLPSKRMTVDKTAKNDNRHSSRSEASEKGKAVRTSRPQRSACQEDSAIVDLTEQNVHAYVFDKVIPTGAPHNIQAHAARKGSLFTNRFPRLHSTGDSSKTFSNSCKVTGIVDDIHKSGSNFDHGKGVALILDSEHKDGCTGSASLKPFTTPRVTGQKRLVRNGCISPKNIAKAKQSAEKHDAGTVEERGQDNTGIVAANGSASGVDIRDLIAEAKDSHRFKGKGVLHHSLSSKEPDARSMRLSRRSSVALKEEANGSSDTNGDASGYFGGLEGWRTTRNRTRKIDSPLPHEDRHFSNGINDSCFANQQHKSEVVPRDHKNESSTRILNVHPQDLGQNVSAPFQTVSSHNHSLGKFNERQQKVNALAKRQRQGSGSINLGECSTSHFDDSEIVFLSPSGEPSNSRSTRNQNLHGLGRQHPIEVVDVSPEIGNCDSNTYSDNNEDSSLRARQVEADEMLARELQEQLYSEELGVGIGEIDAHIALALQQEERSHPAFPSGDNPVFHHRGSSALNLHQRSHSRPSLSSSTRRGIQAQLPTSTRMARLIGRFPGRARTISSTPRSPVFPSNMDVDMRMHILEALETISDMDVANDFLPVAREFNENDYEMLLALDENNHQHGGASIAQINSLPLSTVQTDNSDVCAICLETPSAGEMIRHLPCLHRFHKNCIDPWLRRKTSCPVCKSSIT